MAKPRFDIYQTVTDKIIAAMEAGTPPWRKPWTGSTPGIAFPTRSTGELYLGINVLMLWLEASDKSYTSAHWFTYRQAKEAGGQVRKGEKSATVVKYGTIEREDENGEERRLPYARAYRVFNADQIDGLPSEFYRVAEEPLDLGTECDPKLDAFFAATGLTIESTDEPRAYYDIAADRIHMPPVETFYSAHGYFQTLAHEASHATGHRTRLDRFGKFQSKADYAREELLAEISGTMLCATLGIKPEIEQNAAYVSGWVRALKDDKREIFRAASAAQKAADYLQQMTENAAKAA